MRLLRSLLLVVLVVGVAMGVVGLLLPPSTHLERSVTIERAPAEVHAMLNSYRRFNEWSPWFEADPQARYRFAGPGSGVGASMHWQGEQSGRGSQRIIESLPNSKIVNELDFDGSRAFATFTLRPDGQGTQVTWAFDSAHGNNLLARWFGLLLDRLVGADYEQGLARLKTLLEAEPS